MSSPTTTATPVEPSARAPGRRWSAAAAVIIALGALLAFDGVLFRSGLYALIVEPESTTGTFEMTYRREVRAQQANGDNLIVTLGNSRFAYLPRQANQFSSRSGYVFRHAGLPGTDARSWYYMLRDLDPTARRYRAVLVGVNDYDDEDYGYVPFEDAAPMHYFIARLRLGDLFSFPATLDGVALQWQGVRGILFPGLVYQQDIQALLTHPVKRFRDVALYREGWAGWTYDYEPETTTMTGLEIDWKSWKATFAPGATAVQRETVHDVLMRPVVAQVGVVAAFRRLWFGRILEHYRGSPTRILFVRLPRGPIARPENLVVTRSASLREFAAQGRAALLDEHACDPLERPELFKDAMHLNREGSTRFAAILVDEVTRVLGPGPGAKR